MIRALALPIGVAGAALLALSLLGVQAEFAWAWGLLAGAVILVLRVRMPDDPRHDAPGREAEPDYIGSEVSRLAWGIDPRTGTVNEAVTRRVRATLSRRLLRQGIDIDDPDQRGAVDDQLGAGVWTALNSRRTTTDDVRRALDAAQRLADAEPLRPDRNSTA